MLGVMARSSKEERTTHAPGPGGNTEELPSIGFIRETGPVKLYLKLILRPRFQATVRCAAFRWPLAACYHADSTRKQPRGSHFFPPPLTPQHRTLDAFPSDTHSDATQHAFRLSWHQEISLAVCYIPRVRIPYTQPIPGELWGLCHLRSVLERLPAFPGPGWIPHLASTSPFTRRPKSTKTKPPGKIFHPTLQPKALPMLCHKQSPAQVHTPSHGCLVFEGVQFFPQEPTSKLYHAMLSLKTGT